MYLFFTKKYFNFSNIKKLQKNKLITNFIFRKQNEINVK